MRIGPFRVSRAPANRFAAMDEALAQLVRRGYAPRVVIDAGANVGAWTRLARPLFPAARFHVIEPQPACLPSLRALPGVTLHPFAVSAPGVREVRLVGGGTGAWVAERGQRDGEGATVEARTLDELLSATREDRALLKLDLEGHERSALEGAAALLESVEVVLSEVQLFDELGGACLGELQRFLDERGFSLYDIAALSGRPRDGRLRQADVLWARRDSALLADRAWA